jgi:hypothetical protein
MFVHTETVSNEITRWVIVGNVSVILHSVRFRSLMHKAAGGTPMWNTVDMLESTDSNQIEMIVFNV